MMTRREMNAPFGASLVTLLLGAVSAHRAEAAAPGQNAVAGRRKNFRVE
jgi:hypothetical protein